MLRRALSALALSLSVCALPAVAQSLVTDIPVPGSPSGVAVNPANNRIYVSLGASGGTSVAVIDGNTNTVMTTIPTPQAFVITVNVATGRVYTAGCFVSQTASCGVTVIDGSKDSVIATIPINATNGIGIQGIAVNPVTNRIYVADATNYMIDVIDGATNKIIDSVSLDRTQPLGLAVDFGTNRVMVTINGGAMWILSGTTNRIVRKIAVGAENANTAVNSFTSQAYVTNELFQPSTLGVVNLNNGKVQANVPVGNTPFGVCVDLFTNLVFVTNKGDGTVALLNGKSKRKIGSVAANSTFIDVNPVTRLAYASSGTDNSVYVISE